MSGNQITFQFFKCSLRLILGIVNGLIHQINRGPYNSLIIISYRHIVRSPSFYFHALVEANLLGNCDLCRDIEAFAGGFLSNLRVYARQSQDFSWNSTMVSRVCAKYTSMVTPAWHVHNLVLQFLWVFSLKHLGEIQSWSQSWQLSVSQKNQESAFPASLGSSRFVRISDLGNFFLRYRRGTTNMQWNQSRGEGNRLLDPARLIRLFDYNWILDHFVFQTIYIFFASPAFLAQCDFHSQ